MADIQLRFHRDLLALSAPVESGLRRLGLDVEPGGLAVVNVSEPETLKAAYAPDFIASTPCIVANTADILPAKLARAGLEDKLQEIARASLKLFSDQPVQHIFVEFGPTGLPFDGESRQSCIENRDQYVQAGRVFERLDADEGLHFDAYLLSGITRTEKLKVALMALRQVSDKPIFANVVLDEQGSINVAENVYDVAQIMSEYGASVAGITTSCDIDTCVKMIKRMRAGCDLPIMIEFDCSGVYSDTQVLKSAVVAAADAGAQFFRVSGDVGAAHTGVLVGLTNILQK